MPSPPSPGGKAGRGPGEGGGGAEGRDRRATRARAVGLLGELQSRRSGHSPAPPDDREFGAEYPLAWELLSRGEYSAGKPRFLADLMIEVSGGAWLVTLRDHDSEQQFTVACDAFQSVPAALERLLISGAIPWRAFKSYKRQARR